VREKKDGILISHVQWHPSPFLCIFQVSGGCQGNLNNPYAKMPLVINGVVSRTHKSRNRPNSGGTCGNVPLSLCHQFSRFLAFHCCHAGPMGLLAIQLLDQKHHPRFSAGPGFEKLHNATTNRTFLQPALDLASLSFCQPPTVERQDVGS